MKPEELLYSSIQAQYEWLKKHGMQSLPSEYKILPYEIPLRIPGFIYQSPPWAKTLAPELVESEKWFYGFVDKVENAIHKRQYFPICRISDGEFTFLLGEQPPDRRLPLIERLILLAKLKLRRIKKRGGIHSRVQGLYFAGIYDKTEINKYRLQYGQWLSEISKKGILAIHLTYGGKPFQEHFHPALSKWFRSSGINLTIDNYVPFYFVYALLTGSERKRILAGRRVLVVHGAEGVKRNLIVEGLRKENIADLLWISISPNRSLFDRIDPRPFIDKVDVVLIGAGIGKPNIIAQLEPLQVPCIDAGYVFEVWANRESCWKRPFCAPDWEIDPKRITF